MLVCAYDSDEKFSKNHLDGALSFHEFTERLSTIDPSQEIIFYCAWTKEASAAGQAEKLQADGFTNVKVLKDGVEGWVKAGYPLIPAE